MILSTRVNPACLAIIAWGGCVGASTISEFADSVAESFGHAGQAIIQTSLAARAYHAEYDRWPESVDVLYGFAVEQDIEIMSGLDTLFSVGDRRAEEMELDIGIHSAQFGHRVAGVITIKARAPDFDTLATGSISILKSGRGSRWKLMGEFVLAIPDSATIDMTLRPAPAR